MDSGVAPGRHMDQPDAWTFSLRWSGWMPGFSRFLLHSWETWGHFLWWLEDQVFWTMDESYSRGTYILWSFSWSSLWTWMNFKPSLLLSSGGECDVVVVGFSVNDFGWLWMPLFCPKIDLRINNNRGHVRCHFGVLHLRVPTQLIEPYTTKDASWAFRLERLWLDFCHSVLPFAGLWYASMVMVQWKGFPKI